jgi:hypothetical protein
MSRYLRYASLNLFILLSHLLLNLSYAQGIRGKVTSDKGEELAYASIYIRNTGEGVTSSQSGQFEINTGPGIFDVVVQYMGYVTSVQTIRVSNDWVNITIPLTEQVYALQEVTINSKAEDPALTIMRKAISKARFHRLQVQEYQMTVYMKGTGKLTNVPFLLKKQLEKDGLKVNDAYTSESVSKVKFSLPNKVEETVVSIRTSGDNHNISPTAYVATSFYNDKINEIISPLSRAAFAYYKFTFQGSFFEEGILVNKIKVTPRSKGEGLVEGFIYILDELWAIHSLNLKTSVLGVDLTLKQQFAPIQNQVWMPISQTYDFSGKFMGFAGQFKYITSNKDYKLVLNPDLIAKVNIVDQKVEALPENISTFSKKSPVKNQVNTVTSMEKKEYRKLIKEYETALKKENDSEQILSERVYTIDSLAKKRGLAYWDSIRPFQLSEEEIKGYVREDSVYAVEQAQYSKDSTSKAVLRKFQPMELLTGGRYLFGGGKSIEIAPNVTNFAFNTVEGYKLGLAGTFRWETKEKISDSNLEKIKRWSFTPEVRYGFASQKAYAKTDINFYQREKEKSYRVGLRAGSFIEQYNTDAPITDWVNSIYSLTARLNYAKFFEHDFAELYVNQRINSAFGYSSSLTFSNRRHLSNRSNFSYYNRGERVYLSNTPENIELGEEVFQNHQAVVWSSRIDFRPGLKYVIRNGVKRPVYNSAPLIQLSYKKAIPGFLGDANQASFDQIELGLKNNHQIGMSGQLDYNVSVGNFFNQEKMGFMDFKHFGGNQTIFANMGLVSNYRFLDYYTYSTQSWYYSSIVHYRFKKFLVTRIPRLSFSGVRESLFFNVLKTANSPHYMEFGYSFDNLFRLFRLETGFVMEGEDLRFGGFRVGVSSLFSR